MHIQNQIDRLLTQQASQWVETLRNAGPQEQEAFCQWLRQSRLHVEEFLEVMAIDRALEGLDADRHIDVRALIEQMSPAVVPLQLSSNPIGTRPRARRRWVAAVAAGLAICAIAVPIYLMQQAQSDNEVATVAGEHRTVTLPDGSVVTLNSSSRIRLGYSDQERSVELRDGEAVFRVARDASRPFQVHTSTAIVRAIGTQFNVNRRATGTAVSVLEGRVRIVPRLKDHPGVVDLSAGEAAQIESSGRIQKEAHPDIAKAVAWRRKSLKFREAPLEEIVAEFNRYSAVKLRLEGIELGSQRYGGIFDGSDPESLAAVLERQDDLIVERREGEIVIRDKKHRAQ